MNILYLTNELNYADGVSSHLYYLLSGLKKNFDVNIFLMCGGGDAQIKFKDSGIKVIENKNLNHSNRSINNFTSSILFVYNFVKKNKINIIHSHNHYAANISHRCSKFIDVSTIQTVHGIIPDTGKLKHLICENIITVNDNIYKSVKTKLNSEAKLKLIYNGIDFKNHIRKNSNVKIKFIAASRFETGKGIETYINAVGKLSSKYRELADFFIAGEGSLNESLHQLNKELKSEIKFLGKIKNLRNTLRETDVFIMPSVSEGFPMTILEAAAESNLVISSDFEGTENILTDNDNGLLFQKNNPSALADKIKFVLDNKDIIQNISEIFFMKAKSEFNADLMCRKHFDLYNSII